MSRASALGAGLVFGVGLCVAGMTQPAKVVAFLDVAGAWDPSLALVMAGAIGVHAPALWWIDRRHGGVYASRGAVDARLVAGAAVFGVGWGLGGYCPGPAVASVGAGSLTALVFALAMFVGGAAVRAFERAATSRHEEAPGDTVRA